MVGNINCLLRIKGYKDIALEDNPSDPSAHTLTLMGCLKAGYANPGLKVNPSINFSCIKMYFSAYVLCILRIIKLKTEG